MSLPVSAAIAAAVVFAVTSFAAAAEPAVASVASPPADRRNAHYPGNRAPLVPSPLVPLPVRSIEPRGWLRKQLELQAQGFHGHLPEISRFLEKEKNSWLDPNGRGEHGWEEVPYWLKGYAHCAYVLNDPSMIEEAKVWMEGAIASQQPDGWFGPRKAKSTVESTNGEHDLWPNMVMLFCLQSYHDFTGDPRVLQLMRRYFRWELDLPEAQFLPPFWQQQRAADNLYSVYWLYNRTGEAWLLQLAEKIFRHTADWDEGIASWHNVNIAQGFGGPATFWQQSRDKKHLDAAERNWREVRRLYGQVPGGMFGGDENCRPGFDGPRQAIETCGIVEEMLSDERLLQITGDGRWADRCEDAAYNSLPAAMTADLRALRYLTAPNHVRSDAAPKNPGIQNGGPMYLMDPHGHRCCQHNVGHGWPYLASSLWMATGDNGLAATFYGDSTVTAKVGEAGDEVRVDQRTHYPFDERVELTVSTSRPARFPLYLRVPTWCQSPALQINGADTAVGARPRSFIVIDREWRDGDVVRLTLPMEVRVRRWAENGNTASVKRGPLTYSLKIEEEFRRKGGTEKWPAHEIWPASAWNYGLVLNEADLAASFEVVKRDCPAAWRR